MEAYTEDLDVLQQQRELKARAREEKAARQLAKGTLPATVHVVGPLYFEYMLHCVLTKARERERQRQRLAPRPKQRLEQLKPMRFRT